MTASTMTAPKLPTAAAIDDAPAKLRPKEHGAYAILGIPLVTALAIAGLTPVTILICVAAVAGFLANEPLLVVTGRRGARAQRTTPNAQRVLLQRLALTLVCGGLAFWLADWHVRIGLAACGILAGVGFALSSFGGGRTMAAQLIGIAGLTLPGAVVVATGGSGPEVAFRFWLIWLVGHTATSLAVRSMIAQHKAARSGVPRINDLLMLGVLVAFGMGILFGDKSWVAISPLILGAIGLRIRPPHPSQLKRVGWTLVSVNIISGLWMIWIWAG